MKALILGRVPSLWPVPVMPAHEPVSIAIETKSTSSSSFQWIPGQARYDDGQHDGTFGFSSYIGVDLIEDGFDVGIV
jgi:hypothetical protein